MPISSPGPRAAAALLLFSSWMGLLFAGFLMRGAVHLLLAAGLVLFPWRALPPSAADRDPGPPAAAPPPPADPAP